MAYYQPIQPGVSQVGNLPLPLDEQTLQGMGYSPMAPAMPPVDPGSALGPNAVAGNRGAPLPPPPDPGKIDVAKIAAQNDAADAGGNQFAPGSPEWDQREAQLDQQSAARAAAEARAAAPPIDPQRAAVEQAAASGNRGAQRQLRAMNEDRDAQRAQPAAEPAPAILPTTGKAEQRVERQEDDLSRLYAQADAEAARGGGQPRQLGVAGETRKFTEQAPIDPALAKSIKTHQDELDQAQSNAIEDQAAHEGDRLEQEQALNQQRMQAAQEQIQQRQAIDQRIRKLEAQSDAAQKEIESRTPKGLADYWREQGPAAKISSAISVALGGWLQGRNGGSNPGMDMVNKGIDRWMNDQRQQYEDARDAAKLKNNAYKDALAIYGSPDVAQAQLQLQTYAVRDAMIKNTAQQIGTADALGNAQMLLQQGQLEREKAQAAARGAIQVEQTLKMQGGGGPSGGGVIGALKRRAEIKGLANQITGNTIPEREQALKETEAGGKVKQAYQAQQDVADAADRVQSLTSGLGDRELGQKEGEARAALIEMKAAWVKAHGFGGRQIGVLDEAIADPTKFFRNPGAAGSIKEIKRQAMTNANRALAGHLGAPDQTGPLPGEESQE